MDYEKKYKEIVGEIKKAYLYAQTDSTKAVLEEILPELAQSEDEKVRKDMLEYCYKRMNNEFPTITIHQVKSWLVWLEKQGEHANFRYKIQVGDKVTRNEDGVLVNLSQLERAAKSKEKKIVQKVNYTTIAKTGEGGINAIVTRELPTDGEQRPTDEIKPFDKYEGLTDFERTLADICIGWIGEELGWKEYIKDNADVLLKIAIKKFNSVQGVPFGQNLAIEMKSAEESLGVDSGTYNKIVDECIFGEQKPTDKVEGRIQPQPKQGWSEEDEKIINGLIDSLTRISLNTRTDSTSPNYTFYKEIDWLKSLRPLKRWKPNEDDIIILEKLIKGELEPKIFQATLHGILEQLKKLRDE